MCVCVCVYVSMCVYVCVCVQVLLIALLIQIKREKLKNIKKKMQFIMPTKKMQYIIL